MPDHGSYIKSETREMNKVYIALFTCCVTRAVNLELVEDLKSQTFRRALRRFSSRRRTSVLIVSDDAKTFRTTQKALRGLFDDPEVKNELVRTKTEWRFNLERAPLWGGFFERMVGCVKHCLRKVLGNAKLTFDELLTVLVEIEGTLNSRPLTYTYDEQDEEVLTPSHLMHGRRLQSLPEENVEEPKENWNNCSKRFRHLTLRLINFRNRWKNLPDLTHLTDFREFHKAKVGKTKKTIQEGYVGIVFEENKKRAHWKTAVVERLITGRDEIVGKVTMRGAEVRTIANGKHLRIYMSLGVIQCVQWH